MLNRLAVGLHVTPEYLRYGTRPERDRIVAAADGLPDGLAVALAFYAGLRRGEIWRLRWQDVSLARRRLTVAPGKTGRPRTVPIAFALQGRLEAAQRDKGLCVPTYGQTYEHAAMRLLQALSACLQNVAANRIGWNLFRHTFGSLLAQEGVSLDKISAWMGNSPEICRRHYAQFVPRDRHDEDIERL